LVLVPGEEGGDGKENMVDIFKKGQKTALIAGSATILFAIAKAIVSFISGSLVLMADAIHSAADSFSTFFAWFGLKIAQKSPTEKFPYGFYKVENITALIISGLILFAGFEIIKESIGKIFILGELNIPLVAIGVAVLDAIVMFSIGSYEMKIGKQINSQSLTADGRESRMHLFSSGIVLIGLFARWFGIMYLEGMMGILISLFIFKIGIESAKDSIFALMDVSPSKEIEEKIKKVLEGISGVRGFENLRLRKAGPLVFGEVQVKLGRSVNINRAREISNNIEKEVKRKVKAVDSLMVGIAPAVVESQKICIPVEKEEGLDSKISAYFGRAKKFMFIELEKGEVKNFYFKDNPYSKTKIRAGLEASRFVVKEKIDSIITKEMGPISLHTLRDNIVDVYQGEDGNIKELLKRFSKEKLKLLGEPTREK
jgi:cation diffusion facilitator family transporter